MDINNQFNYFNGVSLNNCFSFIKETLNKQKIILTIVLAVFSSLAIGVGYYYLKTKKMERRNNLPPGFYDSYQQESVGQPKKVDHSRLVKESGGEQAIKKSRDIWFSIFEFADLGSWCHLSQTNQLLSLLSKHSTVCASLLNGKQIPSVKMLEFIKLANPRVLHALDLTDLTFKNSQELEQIFTTFLKLEDVDLNLSCECQGLVTEELLKKLPSGLKHLKLKSKNSRIDRIINVAMENLPRRLLSLDLFITSQDLITHAALEKLPPGLTSLDLGHCRRLIISDIELNKLSSSLTSLSLASVNITGSKINFSQNLTSLDLSFSNITDEIIRKLRFSNLTSLKLWACRNITDAGLEELPESLTSLDLSSCNITDVGVKKLPRGLKFLELSCCEAITDVGIANLPSALTSFTFLGSYLITEEGIATLPRSLTSLVFSSYDKRSYKIETIVKNLPRSLTALELCISRIELGRVGPLKSLVQDLKNFIVTDVNVLDELPEELVSLTLNLGEGMITDENMKKLPPKLKTLSLNNCQNITSAGVKQLPRELISLALCQCEIQDGNLEYLSRNLTSLDLSDCQITDKRIEKLPPKLKVLTLNNCKKITDQGIKKLPKGLKEIDLKNCIKLTDEGLEHLPTGLRLLWLTRADQITNEGMRKLPIGLTNLTIINCLHITRALKTELQSRGIKISIMNL